MDAVKYLKESKRMCDTIRDCEECPLNGLAAVIPCRLVGANLESANPEKAVEVIETWAKANPKKTRQSEFLKAFPNAKLEKGVIRICPQHIEGEDNYACVISTGLPSCTGCRKKYWLTEVE